MAQARDQRSGGGVNADTHISILAALNILGGLFVILGGMFAGWGVWFGTAAATSWMGPWGGFVPQGLEVLATVLLLAAIVIALPAILAGIGLAQRKEWGRILTFVTAAGVALFAIASMTIVPIAYSAYAFWALTRDEVREEFQRVEPREAARQLDDHGGVQEPPEDT